MMKNGTYPRRDENVVIPPQASVPRELTVDPHDKPYRCHDAETPECQVDLWSVVVMGLLRGYHDAADGGILQNLGRSRHGV